METTMKREKHGVKDIGMAVAGTAPSTFRLHWGCRSRLPFGGAKTGR